jgi:hypothetical protein
MNYYKAVRVLRKYPMPFRPSAVLRLLQAKNVKRHATLHFSVLAPRGSHAICGRLVDTVSPATCRGSAAHHRRRALVNMRSASSSGHGSQGEGASTQWQQFKNFWRNLRERKLSNEMYFLRLMWRFGRIVVLGFSIFSLGKVYGAMEYAWDPEEFTKEQLRGCISVDPGKEETPVLPEGSKEVQRVCRVVSRLLKAAEALLEERVDSIK